MKVVYIAAPFTAPNAWAIEQNIRAAEELGLAVAKLGAAPLIPHANTRYFHGTMTEEFWYQATAALLLKCDAVLLRSNWRTSRGATVEKTMAEADGIPVFESIETLRGWLEIPECGECDWPEEWCLCPKPCPF